VIIGWNPSIVDLLVINHSDQVVNCLISSKNGKYKFFCSFIYGHVRASRRRPLWKDLVTLNGMMGNDPWLLVGDFNTILTPDEANTGSSCVTASMVAFKECCEQIGVDDLPGSGCKFTWNKSPGKTDGLLKKLDRVMGNHQFFSQDPSTKASFY